MTRTTKALRASLAAATVLLAFPAAGWAAGTATTDTATTVGTELSVVAPPSSALGGLIHSVPATGSTAVDVTSTSQTWTLTATDAAATGKGFMTNGTTPLGTALQVAAVGGASGDLTSTGVSVGGSLVDTKTFNFTQALGATEDVVAGANYGLTVTYTVSGV
jgi:hypothetical protein